jgi:hypothetical protein
MRSSSCWGFAAKALAVDVAASAAAESPDGAGSLWPRVCWVHNPHPSNRIKGMTMFLIGNVWTPPFRAYHHTPFSYRPDTISRFRKL